MRGDLRWFRSKLEGILDREVSRLRRRKDVLGIGLVGSLRGEDVWEGSDIDLVLVLDHWEEPTPAYGCRLRSGTIIHTTILTREDLAQRREGARRWVEESRILYDQEKEMERAKSAWSREPQTQKRARSLQEVYESEFSKPARSLGQGDLLSCMVYTRPAALRLSSSWLNTKGARTRAGGRRSMDQAISSLQAFGEATTTRALLCLFQADVGTDEAERLLEGMMALSSTTYDFLEKTMLGTYLEPAELGLLGQAATARELVAFLEALYRPLAIHYPRSMAACGQFSSAFLADTILRAQARRDKVGYQEETLVQSLLQADLPRGFMDDFLSLQRFHKTQAAQKQAIGDVTDALKDLISR